MHSACEMERAHNTANIFKYKAFPRGYTHEIN